MAKEYHPDTPQTIPHAALIHSERELNPDNSSYPSYFQRDDWVTAKIADHQLSLPEGAVLRRVSHYAGTTAGCWAGIDRIAADLGCHEKTVRRAIEVLLRDRLVTQGGWRSRVRILMLTLDTGLSARSNIPDTGRRVRSEEDDTGLSARSNIPDSGQRVHDSGQRVHDSGQRVHDSGQRVHDSGQRVHDSGQRVRLTSLTDKEQTERETIYILSSSQKERPGSKQKQDVVLQHYPLIKEDELAEQYILDILKEFDSFGAGRWTSRSAAIATYKRSPSRLARDLEDWQANREKIRLKIETTWDKSQYGIVHQSPDWKDKDTFLDWWLRNWNSDDFEMQQTRWESAHRNR